MIAPDVMLCTTERANPQFLITQLAQNGDWWFELKYDGIRALIMRSDDDVTIINRRRLDITHRYPDVVAQMLRLGPWEGILDGEIIVVDGDGRPDFSLAHLRDAQSSPRGVQGALRKAPASFVAFDVLRAHGQDVRARTWLNRRQVLDGMFPVRPQHVSLTSKDGETMWNFVQERRLEGLVAKRGDAAYRAGRQKAWVKLKATRRLSALVSGFTAGNGSRADLGALELSLWDPQGQALVDIGKVGSGFSVRDLGDVQAHLRSRTPLVVEVEFLEVSRGGSLRMPVFKGVRNDVDPASCTIDTLDL